MIGGATYEEARVVSLINQELAGSGSTANPGTRILLGGTSIHNSSSYLATVQTALTNFPPSFILPPTEISSGNTASGTGPSLNVQLGNLNLSVGGAAGTGLYRGTGEGVGIQADGIRDGVKNLFGKVKQGVESIGLP
jgi:hypothetical protein